MLMIRASYDETFQSFLRFTEKSALDCKFFCNDGQMLKIPRAYLSQNRFLRSLLHSSRSEEIEIFLPDLDLAQTKSVVQFLVTGEVVGGSEAFVKSVLATLINDFGFPAQLQLEENFTDPNAIPCVMSECMEELMPSELILHYKEHVADEVHVAFRDKVEVNASIKCRHCREYINYIGSPDPLTFIQVHYLEHIEDLKKYLKRDFNYEDSAEPDDNSVDGPFLQGESIVQEDTSANAETNADMECDFEENLFSSDDEVDNTNVHDTMDTLSPVRLSPPKPSQKMSKVSPLKIKKSVFGQKKTKKRKASESSKISDTKKKRSTEQDLVICRNDCDQEVPRKRMKTHTMIHIPLPPELAPFKVHEGFQCCKCNYTKKLRKAVKDHFIREHGYLDTYLKTKNCSSFEDFFEEKPRNPPMDIALYGPNAFDNSIQPPVHHEYASDIDPEATTNSDSS